MLRGGAKKPVGHGQVRLALEEAQEADGALARLEASVPDGRDASDRLLPVQREEVARCPHQKEGVGRGEGREQRVPGGRDPVRVAGVQARR